MIVSDVGESLDPPLPWAEPVMWWKATAETQDLVGRARTVEEGKRGKTNPKAEDGTSAS